MSGKGSTPRPKSVDEETFGSNWDRIFGSNEPRIQLMDGPGNDWEQQEHKDNGNS